MAGCLGVALALLLALLAASSPSANSHRTERESEPMCKKGTSFMSGCNLCICGADGKPAYCTGKFCKYEIPVGITPCVPGTPVTVDCNKCICGIHGKPVQCTKRKCRRTNEKGGDGRTGERCVPGTTLMDRCNTCKCNKYGKAVQCTRLWCHPEYPVGIQNCEPGSTVEIHCETCKCGSEGNLYACSKSNCAERQLPLQGGGRSCKPGTTYKEDCNTCICSSDGKTAYCTKHFCGPQAAVGRLENDKCPTQSEIDPPTLDGRVEGRNPGFTCEPNSLFSKDGTTCYCGSDGVSYVCGKPRTKVKIIQGGEEC